MTTDAKPTGKYAVDDALTETEVGQIFKVHKRTILRWERELDGFPQARKFNGVKRFVRSEIMEFLQFGGQKASTRK